MPLGIERRPPGLGLERLLLVNRLDRLLDLVAELGQSRQRHAGEGAAPTKVAAGDERPLGVVGEPGATRVQQFVDLVGPLPVVLGLVENREQHMELAEGVGEPDDPAEPKPDVARVAPLGEGLVEGERNRGSRRITVPINGHDDLVHRQQSPTVRVARIVAIIAQNEELIGRHQGGRGIVGARRRPVRFVNRFAVNDHLAAPHLNRLAGQTNHALDEIPRGITRVVEHDDIAPLWLAQPVGEIVDDQELTVLEVRLHADPVNAVILHDRPHQEEDDQGQNDCFDQFT